MTSQDLMQVILFFALLIGLTPLLGNYMSNVFTGNKHMMLPVFGWQCVCAVLFRVLVPTDLFFFLYAPGLRCQRDSGYCGV